jgi:glutathione S-transferase
VTALPILYSFRRCPYAIRARLAILVSGMTCELREVSLANKPEALAIASPKATIPVMVLPNGQVLDESLDIMIYALSKNDPEGWLVQVGDSAMDMITTNDTVFKVHLDHYKYPDRYDNDAPKHRQAGLEILKCLNGQMTEQCFLAGHSATLVDMAILPFVRQFRAVDEAWFMQQSLPYIHKWLSSLLESEVFVAVMLNWPIWKHGDDPLLFPAV